MKLPPQAANEVARQARKHKVVSVKKAAWCHAKLFFVILTYQLNIFARIVRDSGRAQNFIDAIASLHLQLCCNFIYPQDNHHLSNTYKEKKVVVVVGKRVFGGKVRFVQVYFKKPRGEHAFSTVDNPNTCTHLSTIYPLLFHIDIGGRRLLFDVVLRPSLFDSLVKTTPKGVVFDVGGRRLLFDVVLRRLVIFSQSKRRTETWAN